MDETKETVQDSLPNEGQASAGDAGTTSAKQTKTYSEQEKEKAVSDALAGAGRSAKQLSDLEARLNSQLEAIQLREDKIADWERRREEEELEEARTDPAKMREYQRKQSEKKQLNDLQTQRADIQKEREELNRSKEEHKAEIEAARNATYEMRLFEIEYETGVSAQELKNLKLSSIEQVEAVAKRLSAMSPKRQVASEAENTGEKPFTPDSGVTSGTHGALSPEQFEKLSISEKQKYLSKK